MRSVLTAAVVSRFHSAVLDNVVTVSRGTDGIITEVLIGKLIKIELEPERKLQLAQELQYLLNKGLRSKWA